MVSEREAAKALLPLRPDTPDGGDGCGDFVHPNAPSSHELGPTARSVAKAVVPASGSGEEVSPFIFTSPSNPLTAYSNHICDDGDDDVDDGDEVNDEDDKNMVVANNDDDIITAAAEAAAAAGVVLLPGNQRTNKTKATRRPQAPLSEAMVEVMLDYSALFDQMQEVLEKGNNHDEEGDPSSNHKNLRVNSAGN